MMSVVGMGGYNKQTSDVICCLLMHGYESDWKLIVSDNSDQWQ